MSTETIRPMPTKFGVGFVSEKPVQELSEAGYRYEQVGNYHNYHVTAQCWSWPAIPSVFDITKKYVIDGFSPNLNKTLHVGHLRQLALAKSLHCILLCDTVAILGASLGVTSRALKGWEDWTKFVQYNPRVYYDVLLPNDLIDVREPTAEEAEKGLFKSDNSGGDFDLPKFWDGPEGPVIVVRADGRPLYAFYDLAFAKWVGPTHYITGHEQKEHFRSLGLGDKHLPMGLVLGVDGSKLKSRTGDAMLADEVMTLVQDLLKQHNPEKLMNDYQSKRIAWNILCWNFLHAARETNLKFEAEKWIRPDSPGMYITYTYARFLKAIEPFGTCPFNKNVISLCKDELTESDVKLLGLAEQYNFYYNRAIVKMDPAPIANFAHDLARALGAVYDKEKIRNGRDIYREVIRHVLWRLECCMRNLGMVEIDNV